MTEVLINYASDLPGNVTGLFRANGSSTTLANEYRYTPWGEAEVRQEGTPNPLRYMSREVDGGTGLYYVRNRWYDVQLGRFLSEEPIGLEGGINWYAYAANSPTNLRDPFGLEPCVITYSYKYYKDTGEVIRESVRIIHVTGDCEGSGSGGDGALTPQERERLRCVATNHIAPAARDPFLSLLNRGGATTGTPHRGDVLAWVPSPRNADGTLGGEMCPVP